MDNWIMVWAILLLTRSLSGMEADTLHYPQLVEAFGQYGSVFGTNSFVRGNNIEQEPINAFQAYSLRWVRQTTGANSWEGHYNYPTWGLGFCLIDFFEKEATGVPLAVYGFLNGPFQRKTKWSFNYEVGFGMAFNWKPFNPVNNPTNVAIGAKQSVYIDVGLQYQYRLTPYLNLGLGITAMHFSNGALKLPNQGINVWGPRLNLGYRLKKESFSYPPKTKPLDFHSCNEWSLLVGTGVTNILFHDLPASIEELSKGAFFPMVGLHIQYARHFTYQSKVGVDLGVAYNGANDPQVEVIQGDLELVDGAFRDKLEVTVHPTYIWTVHRFSLVLQPSFYLYRKNNPFNRPPFFQKIGLRYTIAPHLFAGISLRAHQFYISDFIVWQAGYQF